ncbi:MAG: alpha/beta hydrolase [Flavobacteriales bacterium]|nr:alpha/beta hydrolase [Flavobacteriales bacterium]MCB9447169.1 alpha/beta hydrolase [Flavobacteriales bacterium]
MNRLILLHGALGTGNQLTALAGALSPTHETSILTFHGHGNQASDPSPYSMKTFAGEIAGHIRELNWEQPAVFGYSMGGYAALYLAATQPGLTGHIFTYGTQFHWTPESAERECGMLNADKMEAKIPAFAAHLKEEHGDNHWKDVLMRTADMMRELGQNPPLQQQVLKQVTIPVDIMRGNQDRMVEAAPSEQVATWLSKGCFREWDGWGHPLNTIDPKEMATYINRRTAEMQ